ncbi:MAG: cytochrome C [Methylibium sp. NZG]|nr:MAG: cytochrome C [Methylibium sp. NZG]
MKYLLSLLILSAAALGPMRVAQAQDAKEGEKKVAMCIGCHGIAGYQASFPEIHKVPMISGQNAKYIVNSLVAYKKGERKHPTMRAIAASLSDKDMADIAAFYEQHGKEAGVTVPATPPAPPAQVAELLKKGNCASCHGENMNKPIDPGYPKLAGQHADYLFVALKAYQIDNNPQVGRSNAIMVGMARPFTRAELKLMADYIGSLPGDLKTVPESRFRSASR